MPYLSRLAEACKASYKSGLILQLRINGNLQLFPLGQANLVDLTVLLWGFQGQGKNLL